MWKYKEREREREIAKVGGMEARIGDYCAKKMHTVGFRLRS